MKAHVDESKCRGHARCLTFAPEVFSWHDIDDRSYVPDDIVPQGQEDNARQAAASCPEQAITITEVS